jgi:hypothetical protein
VAEDISLPEVFMWLIHLHRQPELLFFGFFLTDIFFAQVVDFSA